MAPHPMPLTRRGLLSLSRPQLAGRSGGYWLHAWRRAMACRFEITLPSELAEHLDAATAALDTVDVTRGRSSPSSATAASSPGSTARPFERPVVVEERAVQLLALCQRRFTARPRAPSTSPRRRSPGSGAS